MTPNELAQKGLSTVLQRMAPDGTQKALAASMGISEAKLSTVKNDRLEDVLLMLACLGLKVVDSSARCVDANAYEFLTKTHQRIMAKAPQLVWEDE